MADSTRSPSSTHAPKEANLTTPGRERRGPTFRASMPDSEALKKEVTQQTETGAGKNTSSGGGQGG